MAFPSDLVRTKDWGTEILTDSDLEGQFDNIIDWIDDAFDETSGHKHDGTTNEGPLIALNGGNIGVSGELQETDGGTGLSTYTQGDLIYASAADTLSKLAKDANESRYLSNQGTSNDPKWEKVDIATGIEIASEAQGDVIYYNGSAWTRLGAGTSGQFLKTQGAAANVVWGDVGSELISTTTWSGATNSGDITIATGKRYLVIFDFDYDSTGNTPQLRFNTGNSTTTNYRYLVKSYDMHTTENETVTGNNSAIIVLSGAAMGSSTTMTGQFFIDTTEANGGTEAHVYGNTIYETASVYACANFFGVWFGGAATDYRIHTVGASTGTAYTYQLSGT